MYDELFKLIDFIDTCYNKFTDEWALNDNFLSINQKKFLIKNIYKDSNVLSFIINYRNYLNESVIYDVFLYNVSTFNSFITYRIKTLNSILYKINNYSKSQKHNYGESPVNKCLNDIFGVRIILDFELDYKSLQSAIKKKYGSKYKCIDSSNGDYSATHIYFKRDNYTFQWELQIWDKNHEKSNYISHKEYKQMYTDWEQSNKNRR